MLTFLKSQLILKRNF
uniref:Uncharacterized protein n=1 Tax=Anguilla anguilla TaxID=7936 RepID=A0A0E9VYH3_ANGAN